MAAADKSEERFELAVVMPVHNEESCIAQVLGEWLAALRQSGVRFNMLVVDDGSDDGTLAILQALAQQNAELAVVNKANSGHGQACIAGYKIAIAQGNSWILQIDSDGQCDPQYFNQFWSAREQGICIQGFRKTREDGLVRLMGSRLFSLITFLMSGTYVRDLNVPYRLMDSASLSSILESAPADFDLANIIVSYLFSTQFQIKWISINFRKRAGGQAKLNTRGNIRATLNFIRQFHALIKNRRIATS